MAVSNVTAELSAINGVLPMYVHWYSSRILRLPTKTTSRISDRSTISSGSLLPISPSTDGYGSPVSVRLSTGFHHMEAMPYASTYNCYRSGEPPFIPIPTCSSLYHQGVMPVLWTVLTSLWLVGVDTGGQWITITGAHFGVSPFNVTVGGRPCTQVRPTTHLLHPNQSNPDIEQPGCRRRRSPCLVRAMLSSLSGHWLLVPCV